MDKIPHNAFIVVADGHGARTFRNTGDGGSIELKQIDTLDQKHLNEDGPSGSQPSESSPKQADEATFAKQLAHYINKRALANKFDHLVLVADPTTLGEMRPQLHKETVSKLVGELGKTLTKASQDDIAKALS